MLHKPVHYNLSNGDNIHVIWLLDRPFRRGTGSILGLDWMDFLRKYGFDRRSFFACVGACTHLREEII